MGWNNGCPIDVRNKIKKTILDKHIGFQKGYKPWNKNKKGIVCGRKKGYKSPEHSEFMKLYMKNNHPFKSKHHSIESRNKMSLSRLNGLKDGSIIIWNKGIKCTYLNKNSFFKKGKGNINYGRRTPTVFGNKHPNWKGGITPENLRLRASLEYRDWRKAVFKRDNYTCQMCFHNNKYLHAHHIERFSKNKNKVFDVSNGITLCKDCHYFFHKTNEFFNLISKISLSV